MPILKLFVLAGKSYSTSWEISRLIVRNPLRLIKDEIEQRFNVQMNIESIILGALKRRKAALPLFTRLLRRVKPKAVVMVVSDGWDRGNAELLENEISKLKRNCHSLIWLNPLLGNPSYQPLTRGMRAALPYLSHFLPLHNLESLLALARTLKSVL